MIIIPNIDAHNGINRANVVDMKMPGMTIAAAITMSNTNERRLPNIATFALLTASCSFFQSSFGYLRFNTNPKMDENRT